MTTIVSSICLLILLVNLSFLHNAVLVQFLSRCIGSLIPFVQRYKSEGHDTIILAGAEYGSGSSRDWAAKGPMLLVHLS